MQVSGSTVIMKLHLHLFIDDLDVNQIYVS